MHPGDLGQDQHVTAGPGTPRPVAGGVVVLGATWQPCWVSTRQIGSTPKRDRCSSMNAITTAVAGPAPARRNSRPPAGSRWPASAHGPPPSARAAAPPPRCMARPAARVDIGLLDPAAQRVWHHPHPRTDPLHRGVHRQRRVLAHRLCDHPRARSRSSFGYFLGAGITPPFRGIRPSSKPGAIHTGPTRPAPAAPPSAANWSPSRPGWPDRNAVHTLHLPRTGPGPNPGSPYGATSSSPPPARPPSPCPFTRRAGPTGDPTHWKSWADQQTRAAQPTKISPPPHPEQCPHSVHGSRLRVGVMAAFTGAFVERGTGGFDKAAAGRCSTSVGPRVARPLSCSRPTWTTSCRVAAGPDRGSQVSVRSGGHSWAAWSLRNDGF